MDFSRLWARLNPLTSPYAILDILIVAMLIFWLLGIIRGTRAVQLLRGVGILLTLALIVGTVTRDQLQTLAWLLNTIIAPALIVGVPILFQPELRRALESLGRSSEFLSRPLAGINRSEILDTIGTIARTAQQLSQQGVGALIVIERSTQLQEYADRGVIIDSRVSLPLLMNIFYPNSPLHDMAVIVRGNRILAANVVLPLSEDITGPRRYGTRHRAAKGISEQSDALAIVVSEETGAISLVQDGRMASYLTEARLRTMLAGLLRVAQDEATS
ncbi:diadenylate cyclase CdaA [Candidatus Chloroploca asiatica]|uniref:Diadenylate cyclase n=1 Tax=Candidatus Chloroploca asiatica TaxID=1506545 RepID=A0A2H3KMN8_9CHLR|nr:diadenylate cyclase CdaA [Candidatus Chloroploca asiatica]PDV99326.1 TIGR00159 family protein [Candidatus Chloroploca asiatica]